MPADQWRRANNRAAYGPARSHAKSKTYTKTLDAIADDWLRYAEGKGNRLPVAFGKYLGKLMQEVPSAYLRWSLSVTSPGPDMLLFQKQAQGELKRRKHLRRQDRQQSRKSARKRVDKLLVQARASRRCQLCGKFTSKGDVYCENCQGHGQTDFPLQHRSHVLRHHLPPWLDVNTELHEIEMNRLHSEAQGVEPLFPDHARPRNGR